MELNEKFGILITNYIYDNQKIINGTFFAGIHGNGKKSL